MGDYRTQGARPFYPPDPAPVVEPEPKPEPSPPRPDRTTRVVVRRMHPIVRALFVLAPLFGALPIASAFAGRTTLSCVRERPAAIPRCIGTDESVFRPLREEFELRSESDVRAVEVDHGDSTEIVLGLPRGELRAGITRGEVREVVADAQAFLRDGRAVRFERSRSIVVGPVIVIAISLLLSAFLAGVTWGPTTLSLDPERRTLSTRRRGPWWRRPRVEDVVFDFSSAKFVFTSPREIDDSGWEKLVLEDGVAREVVIGSPSSVRDASRTLNEALRADYEARGKAPKELIAEIDAQRRRDEAIASFRFDD